MRRSLAGSLLHSDVGGGAFCGGARHRPATRLTREPAGRAAPASCFPAATYNIRHGTKIAARITAKIVHLVA